MDAVKAALGSDGVFCRWSPWTRKTPTRKSKPAEMKHVGRWYRFYWKRGEIVHCYLFFRNYCNLLSWHLFQMDGWLEDDS